MSKYLINRRQLMQAGAMAAGSSLVAARDTETPGRPDMSIEGQRRRGRRMVEIAARQGASRYDDELGLITMDSEAGPYEEHKHRAKYRKGGRVAWWSPEYAIALLETNQQLPRANRILSSICDYLERDAGEPQYGNAIGYSLWEKVEDTNAIVFLIYKLAPVWMKHRDKLEPEVRAKLQRFLEVGAVGLVRRAPIWWYSNIFIMTMAGTLMLARILQRPDLADLATEQWKRWLIDTAECSLVEYNSPTYYAHQIIPTIAIGKYAVDETMREQARKSADFLFTLLAGNYHPPTRSLGGATTRAYMGSCLEATGSYSHMLYYYFDVPFPEAENPDMDSMSMMGAAVMAEYPHEPSDHVRALIHDRQYPDTFVTRYASYFGKDYNPSVVSCTTHHTEDMTVGTHRGIWAHYHQEVPLFIVHRKEGPRPSIFMRGGPTNSLIDAHLAQDRQRILGILYWDPPTFRMMKTWWSYGPPFQAEHRLFLGPAEMYDRILVDGQAVTKDTSFHASSALVAERDDLQVALRSLPTPDSVRQATARLTIDEEDELKLVISYVETHSADAFLVSSPSAFGLYLQVTRDGSATADVKATSSVSPEDHWSLHVDDDLNVRAPISPESRQAHCEATRPPIRDAVVEHPRVPYRTVEQIKKWLGADKV